MSKFKVGDIVQWKDAFSCWRHRLGVQEVTSIKGPYIGLSGEKSDWNHSCFELVTPASEPAQPQPDSLVAAFTAVHDAIAPLSSLDRRKVIHAVKVLLDIQ